MAIQRPPAVGNEFQDLIDAMAVSRGRMEREQLSKIASREAGRGTLGSGRQGALEALLLSRSGEAGLTQRAQLGMQRAGVAQEERRSFEDYQRVAKQAKLDRAHQLRLAEMQQQDQGSGILAGVLQAAGTAAGAYFGGPLGATLGGKLGGVAGGAIESKTEGTAAVF